MDEVTRLKNEIAENKRKIKELEKQTKLPKVPKRELEKFKKWRQETLCHPYLRYYDYINDDGFCGDWVYYLTGWFGMNIEELEKAKQFVSYITNNEEEIKGFEDAIEWVKEELKEELNEK